MRRLLRPHRPLCGRARGGVELGRTATRLNNPNPVCGEDFFLEAEEDEGGLHGTLTLELYDEDSAADEHAASVQLDLQALGGWDQLYEPLELPLSYKSDKRGAKLAKSGRNGRLAVPVAAVGKALTSHLDELAGHESARVDEQAGVFLVPVPDTDEGVWAGMRFGPRATQLLLVTTYDPRSEPPDAPCYDLSYSGRGAPYGSGVGGAGVDGYLVTERVVYRRAVRLAGLGVWGELRALNVPLDAKLGKVRVVERQRLLVDTLEPAAVLRAPSYWLGMPYLAAVKELSKHVATVDTARQAVWLRMDDNQPQPAQLLCLDHSRPSTPSPAPHAAVCASPSRASTAPSTSASAPSVASDDRTAPSSAVGPPQFPAKKAPTKGKGGGRGEHPALLIASTTSELKRGYELGFFSGGGGGGGGGGGRGAGGGGGAALAWACESWRRPVGVAGGAWQAAQVLELRGAFAGGTLEEAIAAFVSELLAEKDASGRQVLLSRLIAMLKDRLRQARPRKPAPQAAALAAAAAAGPRRTAGLASSTASVSQAPSPAHGQGGGARVNAVQAQLSGDAAGQRHQGWRDGEWGAARCTGSPTGAGSGVGRPVGTGAGRLRAEGQGGWRRGGICSGKQQPPGATCRLRSRRPRAATRGRPPPLQTHPP